MKSYGIAHIAKIEILHIYLLRGRMTIINNMFILYFYQLLFSNVISNYNDYYIYYIKSKFNCKDQQLIYLNCLDPSHFCLIRYLNQVQPFTP